MAIAAIDGEELGKDEDCDMLALSFSGTDRVAHYFGVTGVETQDTYLRLDLELARLLKHLDKNVGEGEYLVFLTADHGGPHNPNYMKEQKASAGFIQFVGVKTVAQEALEKAHGPGQWVLDVSNEQVYLNRDYIAQRGLDLGRQQQIVADALIGMEGVMKAVSARTLTTTDYSAGVLELVQNGYDQERSGDVMFVTDPGYYPWEKWYKDKGSDHRAPWNYDTHVPLIFFGKGVQPGSSVREMSITDIAPTIAMMLSIQEPNSTTGKVISEVIK
jgi:predicted AlkP superfamily pyrophosphatase or phosphodiesterase